MARRLPGRVIAVNHNLAALLAPRVEPVSMSGPVADASPTDAACSERQLVLPPTDAGRPTVLRASKKAAEVRISWGGGRG